MTPTYIFIASRAPLIRQPDGHLKFECNVLHSNVDFYFKFDEYSKFNFFFDSPTVQCPPLILAPLVNMTKGGCENKSALFILFIFHSKNSQIPTYHWSKTIESGGKISLWNKCFHYFMLATIIGTQLLQCPFPRVNSSEFSPIMPEEFGEHLIRDQRPFLHTESLQILQIHSSMLVLLFSSPHSFSVGFRSEDRDSNGKRFILCSVAHFLCLFWCLFWIVVLVEDPNTAHYKISNRGSQILIFYLLVIW